MATTTPTTGAPASASEITGWSVSTQAAQAGTVLDQITTLVECIRMVADSMSPIEDADHLRTINRICFLTDTIELVAVKAADMLGKIELDVRLLEPAGC